MKRTILEQLKYEANHFGGDKMETKTNIDKNGIDKRCYGCKLLKDEGEYWNPNIVCTKEENEKCLKDIDE